MFKTYFARSGIFLKKYQKLNIEGTILDEEQLQKHLQRMAMQYTLKAKSDKTTYPMPLLIDNYLEIKKVYNYVIKVINKHNNIFTIKDHVCYTFRVRVTIKMYTNNHLTTDGIDNQNLHK